MQTEFDFVKTLVNMREQRRVFQMQVRGERLRRQELLAKVVAFGEELKAQEEIEDVIFPGDNPDLPECIYVLKNGGGMVRAKYAAAIQGETDHPATIWVDITYLPMMSFDVDVRRVFPIGTDITEYVAKCVAVLQAHDVAINMNKELLKLAREGRFNALVFHREDNPEAAASVLQSATTDALIALTDTVMKLAERFPADDQPTTSTQGGI